VASLEVRICLDVSRMGVISGKRRWNQSGNEFQD